VCARLAAALPAELDGRSRVPTRPSSGLTAAWGDPAVVLRCGVDRPGGLTATSEVLEVDGVEWFLVEGRGGLTFTTVGRATGVQVRVPGSVPRTEASAVLVDLAAAVRRCVPRA
jgi:hypothetical protein